LSEETRNRQRRLLRDEGCPNFADDPVVRQMLTRLDELERLTDPRRPDSERDKDIVASKALGIASELAAYVSGWAVDHKVGLAIEGLGNIPDLMITARTPAYNEVRETVNSHRHETAGLRSPELASGIKRKALSNLLDANIGGLPESLRDPLADALEALEYGETLPLFEPEKEGRKRKFRELQLQLRALRYIEYQFALGGRKHGEKSRIQQVAAEAFGVSVVTLRGWESRLRSKWDRLRVENALTRASYWGDAARAVGDGRFERYFGLSVLQKSGADYKAIQGFSQTKSN
jgi:hypothetical protein